MIFGNTKDMYSSSGSTGFGQHNNSSYMINHSDDMSFVNDGTVGITINDTTYADTHIINRCGDTYYCDGKAYNVSGSSLFGPDGTVWTGIENDQQIRDIILSNIL